MSRVDANSTNKEKVLNENKEPMAMPVSTALNP